MNRGSKMGIISGILDLLFPPKCVFCEKLLKSGEDGVCASCSEHLPSTDGAAVTKRGEFFSVCAAPFYYRGDVRNSLHRYKFSNAHYCAPTYAKILAECITKELAGKYDVVSWVPVSRARRRKRGYDQSQLLASETAKLLGTVPVATLRKTKNTPPQSGIKGAEKRRANVAGVYETCDADIVAGKRILLIDDILTTGATLSECARTLLMSGAEDVICAVLARTE